MTSELVSASAPDRAAPNGGGQPYLSVVNAGKVYDAGAKAFEALRGVDLTVAQGEFVSIVGPSGCGKSTLLKCIAGLERISSGGLRIKGEEVTEPPANMGVVFQRDLLLDWRSVLDNVLIMAEFRGLRAKDLTSRARQLLAMFGLEAAADRYPWQLSGGMRQRASICRALLTDPELLLMDEPFGALDAMTRDQLNYELERLWYETKKTVVFITHGIIEAVYLADRVVIMDRNPGRIAEIIPIDIPRPRNLDCRELPLFGEYVRHIRHVFAARGVAHGE